MASIGRRHRKSTARRLPNEGSSTPFLFGDRILINRNGSLYATNIPAAYRDLRPLLVNPGGTNLSNGTWNEIVPPAAGNQLRRVEYVEGEYIYANSREPLATQPTAPPPVTPGAAIWEVISDGSELGLGTWQIADVATAGDATHWFAGWYYSLDGNGISPKLQFGDNVPNSRASLLRSTDSPAKARSSSTSALPNLVILVGECTT